MRSAYLLYKRGSGGKGGRIYYAAFWNEDRQDYIRRSTGMTSRAAADAVARKWLDEGLSIQDSQNFLIYMEGFWSDGSDYLRGRELRKKPLSTTYIKNSRSAISRYMRAYLEETGQMQIPLHKVTAGLLEKLMLWLESRGLGSARINGIMKAVRVPLSRAARAGKIRDNPASRVERIPDPAPRRQILELSEAKAFFAQEWTDPRYYACNLIAATTGLRLGEIRGLQAEDIREDYLHVCHNWQDTEPEGRKMKGPKHSTLVVIKSRDVPIPPRLSEVLKEMIANNPWRSGFVIWGNTRGKPPSTTVIEKHFKAALRGIGISEEERRRRNLTFHAWRHWYNTNIRPYVPEYQLRMLTGHRDESMTDRYTTITQEQRQAVAKIAEGLLPTPAQ